MIDDGYFYNVDFFHRYSDLAPGEFTALSECLEPVAYSGKNFGGVQGRGSGLVGGPGGGAPRTPENVRKFARNSWRKLQKMLYLRIFCKEISKPCVKFSRVWTKNTIVLGNSEKISKIFDENSMQKLHFYLFLGKFVAKNRNFGNNIIFLQQFFPVRGVAGWTPLTPPAYATALNRCWRIFVMLTFQRLRCNNFHTFCFLKIRVQ